jgi:peptide/nickel transport system substrate-binding protein
VRLRGEVRGIDWRIPQRTWRPELAANARVLRFVPQANLTVLDPIVTTAAVTANHAWMVWDTLFGVDAAQRAKPQMAGGYTISDDGRTYLIKLREGLR